MGIYTDTLERFELEDDWRDDKVAHRDIGRPWIGSTICHTSLRRVPPEHGREGSMTTTGVTATGARVGGSISGSSWSKQQQWEQELQQWEH